MKEEIGDTKPNSLKSQHLASGVKPIMACIGSYDDYEKIPIKEQFSKQADDVHNVNYDGYPVGWDRSNFLHNGLETWIISIVDGSNKFSERLFDCTSLIVVGIDKITGKNISFLSHQDPKRFLLKKNIEIFLDHLQKRFAEIKERCKEGTIDAVIVGGRLGIAGDPNSARKKLDVSAKDIVGELLPLRVLAGVDETITIQNYFNSIALLSRQVQKTFGFEPVVINGPKIIGLDHDDIFYDTPNRRLYFVRPKVTQVIPPSKGEKSEVLPSDFLPSEIDKYKGKWK